MILRPYQLGALNGGTVGGVAYPGIYGALREHRSALLTLATGLGKTVVFARVAEAAVRKGRRVLVLAHRKELIEQARQKLISTTSIDRYDIGVEMGTSKSHRSARVVCASVQTMAGARLAKYAPDHFGLVIVDEAHHAVANSYRAILEHFGGAKVLGVTATPKPLAGTKIFDQLAYQYGLAEGVRDGHLVPIRGQLVAAPEINLRDVRTVAGDFALGELAKAMEADPAVAVTAKSSLDLAGNRPTIVFCVTVEQAHLVAAALNSVRPGCAAALDGGSSPELRETTLARYNRREVQYLVNCALFTEGFDAPLTACVVVARPTKSIVLYIQMIGRGTRLLGATMAESIAAGKPDMLILDLVGATGRHELVQCVDLLAGDDAEVKARAKKRLATQGDLDLVLADVRDEIAREAEERRRQEVEAARYQTREVNPLRDLPQSTMTAEQAPRFYDLDKLAKGRYRGAEDQLRLHRLGVYRGPWTRESAAAMVSEIGKRYRRGLCSPKVAQLLRSKGLNPDTPREIAAAAIEAIKANDWRVPKGLLAEYPELAPRGAA